MSHPGQLTDLYGRDGAGDADPLETREWLEALEAVVRSAGEERGRYLLKRLETQAQDLGIVAHVAPYSFKTAIARSRANPCAMPLSVMALVSSSLGTSRSRIPLNC